MQCSLSAGSVTTLGRRGSGYGKSLLLLFDQILPQCAPRSLSSRCLQHCNFSEYDSSLQPVFSTQGTEASDSEFNVSQEADKTHLLPSVHFVSMFRSKGCESSVRCPLFGLMACTGSWERNWRIVVASDDGRPCLVSSRAIALMVLVILSSSWQSYEKTCSASRAST